MVTTNKMTIDLRVVCIALLLIIVGMFAIWQPWSGSETVVRKIEIDGTSEITDQPDEFQFSPTYQIKGTDRTAIQQQLVTKINTVILGLKELGIDDTDLTLASSTYDMYWNDGTDEVSSNTLTIRVDDKELSQKVQDYLLTTGPEGQISPSATFSNAKQKELEDKARSEAIADARKKAETTAKELGVSLGKVISIEDADDFAFPMPMGDVRVGAVEASALSSTLPVLPGEQDITYSVRVIFEIK